MASTNSNQGSTNSNNSGQGMNNNNSSSQITSVHPDTTNNTDKGNKELEIKVPLFKKK